MLRNLLLSFATLALTGPAAEASTFDITTATGLFTPTFRGDANTTYLGWDQFGEPGDVVINDTTPDIGTGTGSFATTNGEDHQSGSLNYYSGSGSVSEDITFATDGTAGSGFTTVIVQAKTLFGPLGSDIGFTPINGIAPTQVLQGVNATGSGQLFAKYELPGVDGTQSFSISTGPSSLISLGEFVIDTAWSPTGFSPDNAIATPEPTAALLALLSLGGVAATRRR